eukprot:297135-Amphidinium_carterae.1
MLYCSVSTIVNNDKVFVDSTTTSPNRVVLLKIIQGHAQQTSACLGQAAHHSSSKPPLTCSMHHQPTCAFTRVSCHSNPTHSFPEFRSSLSNHTNSRQ